MNYSDFWNDGNTRRSIIDNFLADNVPASTGKDLVQLAGYKKAISNFVNIIAGKSVPVTFKGNDSYTDGKKVVLSGNIKESNFDYNCGLAMHEGSHIVYSTFFGYDDFVRMTFELVGNKYSDDRNFINTLKEVTNYIEDRRIDKLVYDSAPGYKGYYKALYAKYFEAKAITKALKSKTFAQENTVSNYMFYITNMTNQFCDSNDLPKLRFIFKLIDLNNISRLKNTTDVLKLSVHVTKEIFDIVDKNIESDEEGTTEGKKRSKNGMGNSFTESEFEPSQVPVTNTENAGEMLSQRQQTLLRNAVQKQRDFIKGDVKKTGLKRNDQATIKALEKSNVSEQVVETKSDYGTVTKHSVIVFEKVTDELVESRMVPVLRKWIVPRVQLEREELISDALRIGTLLGRKLQIRNEEKSLLTTRQSKGKIDKRLISELGFGNDKVFSHLEVSQFSNVNLHLSIDASGSMHGDKICQALKSAIAIAKAASMTHNIDVQISLRTTMGRRSQATVVMLYNSKVNNIKHLLKYAKSVDAGGLTPEGLAFDAIRNIIMRERSENNIFINYSDGMPYSDNYGGNMAIRHTQKAVNDLRYNGYKILSFFIGNSEHEYPETKADFKTMYGKGASFIEPTNVMMVARNLNNMFLEK